jgi:hypothetical protein
MDVNKAIISQVIQVNDMEKFISIESFSSIDRVNLEKVSGSELFNKLTVFLHPNSIEVNFNTDKKTPEDLSSFLEEQQLAFILLTNTLRTFINLDKYKEVIELVNDSKLISFVDKISVELIEKVLTNDQE